MTDTPIPGIQRACDIAGGAPQLAAKLGVSHQAVYGWLKQGFAPMLRAREIEALTGVARQDILDTRLLHLVGAPTDADFTPQV